MSYLQWDAIFLLPPIAVLVAVWRRRSGARIWPQLVLISALAVAFAGPLDGAFVTAGVWSYADGQIAGPTVLRVPLEEYGLFVLQVVMVGLVTAILLRGRERTR